MANLAPFEIALIALLIGVEFGVCMLPRLFARRRQRLAPVQAARARSESETAQ